MYAKNQFRGTPKRNCIPAAVSGTTYRKYHCRWQTERCGHLEQDRVDMMFSEKRGDIKSLAPAESSDGKLPAF